MQMYKIVHEPSAGDPARPRQGLREAAEAARRQRRTQHLVYELTQYAAVAFIQQ